MQEGESKQDATSQTVDEWGKIGHTTGEVGGGSKEWADREENNTNSVVKII